MRVALGLRLVLIAGLVFAVSSCTPDHGGGGGGGGNPVAPPPDDDGDGVPNASDNCPTLAGETQYSGCPWYRVDICSGATPYAFQAHKWGITNPTFYYSSSLPTGWRAAVDAAATVWNNVGANIKIYKYTTILAAGAAHDGKSVISYGPLSSDRLGETQTWYSLTTGRVIEADIVLNSTKRLGTVPDARTFDVYSVLVHECGHFLGLDHVNDRTHSMYYSIPADCSIYRTLCGGDRLGLKRLYP